MKIIEKLILIIYSYFKERVKTHKVASRNPSKLIDIPINFKYKNSRTMFCLKYW